MIKNIITLSQNGYTGTAELIEKNNGFYAFIIVPFKSPQKAYLFTNNKVVAIEKAKKELSFALCNCTNF